MRVVQVPGTACTCALPRFCSRVLQHWLDREVSLRRCHARTRLWLSPPYPPSPQEASSCSRRCMRVAQVPGIACTCALPRSCGRVLQHWLDQEVCVRRYHARGAFGLVRPAPIWLTVQAKGAKFQAKKGAGKPAHSLVPSCLPCPAILASSS